MKFIDNNTQFKRIIYFKSLMSDTEREEKYFKARKDFVRPDKQDIYYKKEKEKKQRERTIDKFDKHFNEKRSLPTKEEDITYKLYFHNPDMIIFRPKEVLKDI